MRGYGMSAHGAAGRQGTVLIGKLLLTRSILDPRGGHMTSRARLRELTSLDQKSPAGQRMKRVRSGMIGAER